jgi:hypothetical protein
MSSSSNPSLEVSDSGSEFELSLDTGDESVVLESSPDDSASDSEFDLTLDDTGNPQSHVEARDEEVDANESKDIFETDFEVPGLDEETGSQDDGALDADTDLESSDFDIEDESGSQVVALDDEYDEPPPSKQRGKGKQKAAPLPPSGRGQRQVKGRPAAPAADDAYAEEEAAQQEQQGAFDQLAEEELDAGFPDPQAAPRVVVQEKVKYIRPAPWGALPSILMFPCLLVMLVVGLIAFEQVQDPNGYKPDGLVTKMMKDVFKNLGV